MSLHTVVMINDVNKAELFVSLYNSSRTYNAAEVVILTRGNAEEILAKQKQFTKFQGKYMYLDFSDDEKINFYSYNSWNGTNAGQAVLNGIRHRNKLKPSAAAIKQVNTQRDFNAIAHGNTNDFIPNSTNPKPRVGFVGGGSLIRSPKSPKIIDTSQIFNPATQPYVPPPQRKKIQVINPRVGLSSHAELYIESRLKTSARQLEINLNSSASSNSSSSSSSSSSNTSNTPNPPNPSNSTSSNTPNHLNRQPPQNLQDETVEITEKDLENININDADESNNHEQDKSNTIEMVSDIEKLTIDSSVDGQQGVDNRLFKRPWPKHGSQK